jgi:hypothetical protein
MATSSSGAGDPDKAKDRLITWRAALLTTIAGLLVAAISAGSAFVGVVLTSSNAREQAREEFLRTQRQELYAQFFTSYDELFNDVLEAPRDSDGFTPAEATELANRMAGLRVDLNALQLVSSENTGRAASAMYSDLSSFFDSEMRDYCHLVPPPSADLCSDPNAKSEPVAYGDIVSDVRQFLEAARADVGAS